MKKIFENKKVLIGIGVLLLLIIAISISFMLKKDNKVNSNKNEDVSKYNYYDVLSYLKLNDLPDEYYGYFYKKDGFNTNDISNNIKIYMAIRKVIADKSLTENIEIKASDVEDALKTIFGSSVKYNHQSIIGNNISYTTFNYDKDKNIYKEDKLKCTENCESPRNDSIISKIVKTNNNDDIIEVYEMVGFVATGYNLQDKKVVYYIYKDIDKKQLVGTSDIYSIDQYKDKLSTYKYTFRKDKNNYYFEKVELVK